MLFVPASKPALMSKAAATDADAVCFDLEDSVVASEKEASRSHVVRGLQELDFGARVRMLRINGLDTPYAYRDLVDVVEEAGDRIDVVMLPKAGGAGDIAFVDRLLTQIESHRRYTHRIGIEAQIESAQGFLYVREIAAASARLEGLVFGPGDFAASMGMPLAHIGEFDRHDESYPGHRWHAVMQTIVAAARAHGLRCMDGPYAAYKDAEGLARSSRIARSLGFDGKQCIHPSQVAVVNTTFSPSDEDVQSARALVDAYEAAVAAGQGAATHEGRMIDAVSLRMARTILGRHQHRPTT